MRVREFLQRAKAELQNVSGTPDLDAEILLMEAIGKNREFLFSRPDFLLSSKQIDTAGKLLQQRKRGIPIAYLLGKCEFYGIVFQVNEHILIPRPETELLVELALARLQGGGTLLDIGTGSGCIAIAVKKHSADTSVLATDISVSALACARENATSNNVHITFRVSDLFQAIDFKSITQQPVVITANLPYVPEAERHSSTLFEPEQALLSGPDGLTHYRRFFAELSHKHFDACFFEFHSPQMAALQEIAFELFPEYSLAFAQDYAGLWRVGILEKK